MGYTYGAQATCEYFVGLIYVQNIYPESRVHGAKNFSQGMNVNEGERCRKQSTNMSVCRRVHRDEALGRQTDHHQEAGGGCELPDGKKSLDFVYGLM